MSADKMLDLTGHDQKSVELIGPQSGMPLVVPASRPIAPFAGQGQPLNSMLAKRYELKYRISESLAVAIKSYVRGYLQPDPYILRSERGMYQIASVYMDSPRYTLFQETQLDKCNRYKLRIRGYDDDPNTPVFFEIKRKLNGIIYKSRARVSKNEIADVLAGRYVPRGASEQDTLALRQFLHYCHCLKAKPIVLVKYWREAFENQGESRLRVTFDREICSCRAKEPMVRVGGPGWKKLPVDFVVLEIKFTGSFPNWIRQMVQIFNINRQSMSKYCRSVDHLVSTGAVPKM